MTTTPNTPNPRTDRNIVPRSHMGILGTVAVFPGFAYVVVSVTTYDTYMVETLLIPGDTITLPGDTITLPPDVMEPWYTPLTGGEGMMAATSVAARWAQMIYEANI